jgi:HSP20 family protein
MNTFLPSLRSGSILRPFLSDFLADIEESVLPSSFSAHQTDRFKMDVTEYQDKYVIVADLPGRSNGDVEVTLHHSELTIEVKPQVELDESRENKVNFILRERWIGAMKRTIKLPYTTTESNVNATMKDGVLTVTIKKEEAFMPKKIAVH